MIEIKVGTFVKEHIGNIIKFCEKNIYEIGDLQKNKFGISYPFLSEVNNIPKGRQRYWKQEYNINKKKYRVCSEFGGSRKNSENKTLSEQHGREFYEYLKSKNILLDKYKNEEIKFIVGDKNNVFTEEERKYFITIAENKKLRYNNNAKTYFQIFPKSVPESEGSGGLHYEFWKKNEEGFKLFIHVENKAKDYKKLRVSVFNKKESTRGVVEEEITNISFENIEKIFNDVYSEYEEKMNMYYDNESMYENKEKDMMLALNQIFYGPPGTGKTYNTIDRALQIVDGKVPDNREEAKERFKALKESGQIEFVTFHQSYGYEEFVEGIKAKTTDGGIEYRIEAGIFKRLSEEAKVDSVSLKTNSVFSKLYDDFVNDLEYMIDEESQGQEYKTKRGNVFTVFRNKFSIVVKANTTSISLSKDLLQRAMYENKSPYYGSYVNILLPIILKGNEVDIVSEQENTKNYILIIDEINRGNISKIFGELITLIEESKRLGKDEAMEVTLPYSGEKFGVPKNLYIIGTMNTADRSIALMDTALRRRFEFEEMMPKPELLDEVEGIDMQQLLTKINQRIEYLYDRDHTIGHAYFMGVVDKSSLDSAMRNKVIPLLQEYFYDDWEKIQIVLGDHKEQGKEEHDKFIRSMPINEKDILGFSYDELDEEEYSYSINETFTQEAYLKLYE